MKNKYLIIILLVSASGFFLGSCKKYLNINDNPNNAQEVDAKLLFSFATTTLVNNRAGGDLFIPMALGGQSMSSGGNSDEGISWGSSSEDVYVFSTFSYANIWTQFYTSVGFNLKKAIDQAENGIPRNDNGSAQAKVILAETLYELTTVYGDIPYSEAFSDTIKSPKFDTQKQIFDSAISLIDQALSQFDPNNVFSFSGAYDLFYGGNIPNWIKAAHSLKLRILMTMVDADPSKKANIATLLDEGGFISRRAENMKAPFDGTPGKRNPKSAINEDYNGGIDFFYASPFVVNFMNSTGDLRLPKYFDMGYGIGVPGYIGIAAGLNAVDSIHAKIASTVHTADQPEYLFTYQEQLFYESEIYARGLTGAVDMNRANDLYKKAITESGIFWGVDSLSMANYANALPSLSSMSAANAIKAIHYQHWIDKFDRGLDAFTQWRRSGVDGDETPLLTLPEDAPEGALFRRYEYPITAELSANPNAPTLIKFNIKMWFDL